MFPGDPEYEKATEIYNQAYAKFKPAFVVYPRTEKHVQKALKCSREHSVPLAVKSGKYYNFVLFYPNTS